MSTGKQPNDNDSAGDSNYRKRKTEFNKKEEARNKQQMSKVIGMVQANFDEFAEKCQEIIDKLDKFEDDCIKETQPIDKTVKDRHLSNIHTMKASLNLLLAHLISSKD